ncbi:Pyrethroid hydrolase [Streptomyces sp. YIM 130001]|uniref:alpha/beta fold hydrolase n=1 Tax=Streptomyces sp. YIM 130001 TaxID=2259644 RepID=UPI000E6565E5|nr:alpha/beta hydrolase [Streptomyces sp. YIM 130001]RII09251.1 Pyrethroid hydrolase [Streptomyces sp. YIM 130001]
MSKGSNRKPLRRSPLALTAFGAASAALALTVAGTADAGTDHRAESAKPRGDQTPRPTVVLVHGAFADGSSWNGVIERLKRDGYPVIAPANPLRGLTSDATYLRRVLDSVEGPVVLAGHSYGGSVITEAAAGNKNVRALVYVAAFTPDKGESAGELSAKYPGSTLSSTLNEVPTSLPDGSKVTDLYIQQEKFHRQFAADVPRSTAQQMAAAQRPVASAALEEGAADAAWKSVPSWSLITTEDRNIPAAAQEFMADRARAHAVSVKASHAVTVSRPGTVAHLIDQAAGATR